MVLVKHKSVPGVDNYGHWIVTSYELTYDHHLRSWAAHHNLIYSIWPLIKRSKLQMLCKWNRKRNLAIGVCANDNSFTDHQLVTHWDWAQQCVRRDVVMFEMSGQTGLTEVLPESIVSDSMSANLVGSSVDERCTRFHWITSTVRKSNHWTRHRTKPYWFRSRKQALPQMFTNCTNESESGGSDHWSVIIQIWGSAHRLRHSVNRGLTGMPGMPGMANKTEGQSLMIGAIVDRDGQSRDELTWSTLCTLCLLYNALQSSFMRQHSSCAEMKGIRRTVGSLGNHRLLAQPDWLTRTDRTDDNRQCFAISSCLWQWFHMWSEQGSHRQGLSHRNRPSNRVKWHSMVSSRVGQCRFVITNVSSYVVYCIK